MKKFLVFLSLSFMFLSCATTVDLENDYFQEAFEDDLQSDEFKEYINNSDNWISREEVGRKKREFDIKEYNRRRKQKEQEDLMNSNEEKALKIWWRYFT